MSRWRDSWAVAIAAAVLTAAPAQADSSLDTIRVHTEAWADYTERDGAGMAWDVLRAVYEPEGIAIEKTFVPYTRAVRGVVGGEADAWIGAYANEHADALYPEWHYDADKVEALFRRENLPAWSGPPNLTTGTVGWVRGYAYDSYLDLDMSLTLLDDRERVFTMLRQRRLKYWLDARYEIDHLLESAGDAVDLEDYARRPVMTQKLYMPFAPTERGRKLRAIWDRRVPELLENGRMAKIYERWNFSIWPFDHPRGDSHAGEPVN